MWIHLLLGSFLLVAPTLIIISALIGRLRNAQRLPGHSTYRDACGSVNKSGYEYSVSQEAQIGLRGKAMLVNTKRIYEGVESSDGERILVDRAWPWGTSKEKAGLSAWRKDLAPSTALRKWFGHDPNVWDEFLEHYRTELEEADKTEDLREIGERATAGNITLVFAARDPVHNNARALQQFIEELQG